MRVYAGKTLINKYGRKAVEFVKSCMVPNENGFYSIPVESKYLVIGYSEGRYGTFAKYGDTFFSVNSIGACWAKEGTAKAEAFLNYMQEIIDEMNRMNDARFSHDDEEE